MLASPWICSGVLPTVKSSVFVGPGATALIVMFLYLNDSNLIVSIHVPHPDGTVDKMQQLLIDYRSQHSKQLESSPRV